MKTNITQGLSKEHADEVKQEFFSSVNLRKQLIKVLEQKVETLRKERRASNSYENPSWAYSQADSIGYERAIFEFISLLVSK